MSKIGIQGSSLAPTLCTLWYQDRAGSADKTGLHEVYARLNILGALACKDRDEFSQLFGAETLAGLYSRIILAPGPSNWRWDQMWKPSGETRKPGVVEITRDVFTAKDAWRDERPDVKRGRIGEMALRVAVISASANWDRTITPECLAAALRFAEWQEKVKMVYQASEALNLDATITGAILDALDEEGGELVKFRDLSRKKNWSRKYGATNVTRVKDALTRDGLIYAEQVPDKNGEPIHGRYTGYVAAAR
jgi:hypothetical protein